MSARMRSIARGSGLLLVLLAFWTAPAAAKQALVHAYGDESRQVGQAFLAHHGEVCVAILPTHVLDEAGEPAALRGEGRPARLGETSHRIDLGDDLSIAVVEGGLREDCGYALGSIRRAIGHAIRRSGVATLRKQTSAGTIEQRSVSILDDAGDHVLIVRLTNANDDVMQGDSGSLLVAGDVPIGILLAYDNEDDAGMVLRIDTALRRIDEHIARNGLVSAKPPPSPGPAPESASAPPPNPASGSRRSGSTPPIDPLALMAQHGVGGAFAPRSAPDGGAPPAIAPPSGESARARGAAPAADRRGGEPTIDAALPGSERLIGWSAMPIDAGHRASNLVAGDGAPPYIARVESWPVELELELADGEDVVVRGLRLEGEAISDPSMLPRTIELFANLGRARKRWRSVTDGELDFVGGRATLSFVPIRARQLKLVIWDAQGSASQVGLERIRLLR